MNDVTGWSIATVIGVVAVGVAYLSRAALGKRVEADARADMNAPRERLAAVWGLLVPAVTVLFLSWQALLGGRWHDGFHTWTDAHDAYIRAWFSFWWLMLLIDGCEFALRLIFALRGRPFPVPRLIRNILRVVLVACAVLLVAKGILNRDISTALASTALLTAVIGFALQGVLGNLLAGLSMHVVRSTVPGDWVAVGDVEGEVIETNWRETRLRTVGGHVLVLPNSKVAESVIHNMTHPTPLRRISVAVGASYSDAPADVIAALEAAALSVPDVLREPKPMAVLTQYLDFGINYELRFWTNRYFDRARLISDVQCRIWYQFKRHGIEIPFPMSDKLLNDFMEVVYHQRTTPPSDEQVERHLAELKRSDFCRKLLLDAQGESLVDDEALRPVVRMMRRVFYTKGETLFRQGETGETAYVLVRGTVDGRVEFDADVAPHAFSVHAGALLGEMSLVTGLPRTATLVAADEVQLLEIPHEAFVRLLGVRDDIPDKLAELSAQRAAQNAAMFDQLKAMPRAGLKESLQRDSILKRFMRMLSFKA
jgi:small-conductance mechanosensitive channel/CRP-like cAMP-binding protein